MKTNTAQMVARYLRIIKYLQINSTATINELAEHFAVSRRVMRDDVALIQMAGDTTNPHLMGHLVSLGHRWLDEGKLEYIDAQGTEFLLHLTDYEISILHDKLKSLLEVINSPVAKGLLKKIQSVRLSTVNAIPEILLNSKIEEAIKSNSLISFEYNKKLRKILPISIKVFSKDDEFNYYLYGYDMQVHTNRIYIYTKIRDVKIVDEDDFTSEVKPDGSAQSEQELNFAVIKYKPSYFETAYSIPYEELREDVDGSITARIRVQNLDWFKSFIELNAYKMVSVKVSDFSMLPEVLRN